MLSYCTNKLTNLAYVTLRWRDARCSTLCSRCACNGILGNQFRLLSSGLGLHWSHSIDRVRWFISLVVLVPLAMIMEKVSRAVIVAEWKTHRCSGAAGLCRYTCFSLRTRGDVARERRSSGVA